MNKRSWTNGAGEARDRNAAMTVIGAPASQLGTYAAPPSASHIEIPPEPLKPAPVAAPKKRRTAAKSSPALTTEAAPRKTPVLRAPESSLAPRVHATRTAAPQRRDSSAKPRTPTRRAKSRAAAQDAVARGDCETVDRDAAEVRKRLGQARANGRTAAERGGEENAGSDDVQGTSAAGTGPMGAGCADPRACADPALSRPKKGKQVAKRTRNAASAQNTADVATLKVPTDPGALADGPAYVRSVAQHVDLVAASARLVISTDEKVSKAELDRLRELIFGKGGPPPTEEEFRIDLTGFPRPNRGPANAAAMAATNLGGERDDS